MIDITNIESKIATIEPSFKVILDYLVKAEGNVLERNDGESDITAPLGVYRKHHSDAIVFEYIDSIATQITKSPSNTWSQSTIKLIDAKLDKRVCYYLAYVEYKKFYKNANFPLYHPETLITVSSIYANGPELCNKSVQLAVNLMAAKGLVTPVKGKPIAVDGAISATGETSKELVNIRDTLGNNIDYNDPEAMKKTVNNLLNLNFDLMIMLMAKSGYIGLDQTDPEKYHKFLRGWDNRVNALITL